MKTGSLYLTLTTLILCGSMVHAEPVYTFGPPDDDTSEEVPVAPPAPAVRVNQKLGLTPSSSKPVVQKPVAQKPVVTPVKQTPVAQTPAQKPVVKMPAAPEAATGVRLVAFVNRTTQKISVKAFAPDGRVVEEIDMTCKEGKKICPDDISTGGGLKARFSPEMIDAGKKPYCSETPNIPIVNADGSFKHPDNVHYLQNLPPPFANQPYKYIPANGNRAGATMEEVHFSKTYLTNSGSQTRMEKAIRLTEPEDHPDDGIFFHVVPGSYYGVDFKQLKHNMSGQCVRLYPSTAEKLYAMTKKYGGVYVSLQGENPMPITDRRSPFYNDCNEQMRADAQEQNEEAVREHKSWGIGDFFSSLFGGGGSSAGRNNGSGGGSTYTPPVRHDDDWARNPLGGSASR